jgi:hypothetical protein
MHTHTATACRFLPELNRLLPVRGTPSLSANPEAYLRPQPVGSLEQNTPTTLNQEDHTMAFFDLW